MSDMQLKVSGCNSGPIHFHVMTLSKLLTHTHASWHQSV